MLCLLVNIDVFVKILVGNALAIYSLPDTGGKEFTNPVPLGAALSTKREQPPVCGVPGLPRSRSARLAVGDHPGEEKGLGDSLVLSSAAQAWRRVRRLRPAPPAGGPARGRGPGQRPERADLPGGTALGEAVVPF